MLKTNMCGELQIKDIGAEVVLAGWVARRRDHGGLTFIDLRDSSGTIQIVIKNEKLNLSEKELNQIRNEWVLGIKGLVTERQEGTRNPNMPTGDIEVSVIELEIINPSNTPPFPINEDLTLDEANRMKYRYLDLRRSKMNQNLKLRHDVMQFIRNFLSNKKVLFTGGCGFIGYYFFFLIINWNKKNKKNKINYTVLDNIKKNLIG